MLKNFVIFLLSIVVFIGMTAAGLDAFYGGGDKFPDRTTSSTLPEDALKPVANLDFPPGNIAVSKDQRVFFTFHPEGRPDFNVAELVNGKAIPLQFKSETTVELESVLSLRIDHNNQLWMLDYANHGSGQPKIVAVDLDTMSLSHYYEFDDQIAGLGSHMNDFQIDPNGKYIYIADASILGLDPAVIVYDIENKTARRAIENHPSVDPDYYVPFVEGEKMMMLGVFAIRPGVDSIALDRQGKWLYFAPVTDEKLYRVPVEALKSQSLTQEQLYATIEPFADKTMSDGLTTDNEGNIYISDMEHSAIIRMNRSGEMETLYKHPTLRWPDGFSFGPNGDLYVTASALQDVMLKPDSYIAEKGPYQIFKLETSQTAAPGH